MEGMALFLGLCVLLGKKRPLSKLNKVLVGQLSPPSSLLSQTLEDWTFASVPADFFFLFPLQCAEYISWHHDRCSNWEWITSLGTRPWNTIVKVYYLELVNSPQILWEPTASYGFHLKFVRIPDSCLPNSS